MNASQRELLARRVWAVGHGTGTTVRSAGALPSARVVANYRGEQYGSRVGPWLPNVSETCASYRGPLVYASGLAFPAREAWQVVAGLMRPVHHGVLMPPETDGLVGAERDAYAAQAKAAAFAFLEAHWAAVDRGEIDEL